MKRATALLYGLESSQRWNYDADDAEEQAALALQDLEAVMKLRV